MATKSNIRSIRFSDELAELIDRQVGRTFTEKFENLVTRCVWELPAKEKELEAVQRQIKEQEARLQRLWQEYDSVKNTINQLAPKANALKLLLVGALERWKA